MKTAKKTKVSLIVTAIISIVVVLSIGYMYHNYKERSFVKILNNTNSVLYNVRIIYTTSGRADILDDIDIKETVEHRIDDSVEDSISVKFQDDKGIAHEDVIIGYTMKNMDSVTINIIEDSHGIIDIMND